MIYIATALYAEAHAAIVHFHLKKEVSHTHFQVFLNNEMGICLFVTGAGAVPAAAALSSICTEHRAGQGDFLVNIGICAGIGNETASVDGNESPGQMGKIFLCNKIKDQTTGRTFYPDILYRHEFAEAKIVTGARQYINAGNTGTGSEGFCLYDMEAAAIYQAGSYYFGPHQMIFLKVVSDDGDIVSAREITPEKIKSLISGNMETIADYIMHLQSIIQIRKERLKIDFAKAAFTKTPDLESADPKSAFTGSAIQEDNLQAKTARLCRDLHCSQTMSASVCQFIRYLALSGINPVPAIEDMYREGKLPCKDKREGKLYFEELKQRLL